MRRVIERSATSVPAAPKLTRVAAYARVSSGKDAMLHSLSAQVSYYSNLIQSDPNWQYVGVYSDEAISGTKEDRPGLQQLIADCQSGKVDMVITKSISRFARNTVTLLETVRMLKALEVDVYFEEQNIHTMSADGELMLSILASYAQEEARSASENQRWRIQKNFEEGMPWNGTVLGYRMVKGVYTIVPEEAALVKRIFTEYLNGAGISQIGKNLDADGIPPRRGERWHHSTIRTILSNYSYTGNLILQKTFREDHMSKRTLINEGQLPKYHAENSHEAIIDLDTFMAVQAEMERRSKLYSPKDTTKKEYPYTGLIVCAKCGKNYRRKITATQIVWICATFNIRGKKYCASKQVPEIVLDALVAEITDSLANIKKIEADDGNVLRFHMIDGSVVTRVWKDRSRSDSWTEEQRNAARNRLQERRQSR